MMTPHLSPGPVKWIAGFVVALVLFVYGSGRVLAQTNFEENVILVKLTETAANQLDIRIVNNIVETGLPSLDALNQQYGARAMNRVLRNAGKFEARHAQFGLTRYYRLQFDAGAEVDALTQVYGADANLESAQPDWRYELSDDRKKSPRVNFTPNDPSYPNQWHYNNTGQNGGTPDADIDLPEAWDIETGDPSVIVSDLDTGQDIDHPDLAANLWVNPGEIPGNGIDDDNNGYVDDVRGWDFSDNDNNPDDYHDHGTHTAGTVAAITNNNVGVAGVAFNARVMACKIFPNAISSVIANAFTYAADNGSIVSTNSWGGGGQSNLIEDAIDYYLATTDGAVVFAAGNDNSSSPSLGYPASYEPVIAVAATNFNDQKAWYSNYGSWVDVSAPGGETMVTNQGVLSTVRGGYAYFQGTSMACPHVAGLAALLFSANPSWSGAQVRAQIEASTDNIDAANPGFAGLLGTGRINAYKALSGGPFPEPPTNLQANVTGSDVQLSWDDPTTNTDGSPINLQHINIYRNGAEIAEVAPGVETYTDAGVPDGSHTYHATATNVEGEESGPSNSVAVLVGDIDVLIWMHPEVGDPTNLAEKAQERNMSLAEIQELVKEPTSHLAIKAALEANGKAVLVVSDITTVDLSQFQAVFVIAGAWPNNYRIPAGGPEALAIVNYVTGGGRAYIEGNEVWYFDPIFGGHDFGPLFSLDGLADGGGGFSAILGANFAAGLNFNYSCVTSFNDVIGPLGTASVIHSNQSPAFNCGVASDQGSYKTIGVSHQFGCLVDGASTKSQLMAKYLEFFDAPPVSPEIEVTPLSFDFTVPPGGSASGVLTISNIGEGTLNWSIAEQEGTLVLNTGQKLPVTIKQNAAPPPQAPSVSSPAASKVLEHSLESGVIVPAGPQCSDGEIYDDGAAENGYGWNPLVVTDGRIVQRFNPPTLPFNYTQVCFAWTRTGADSEIDFNIYVYDDNGAGGAPGTLLASIPAVASGVPVWPSVAFYDFDVTGLVPEINAPGIYIGAQWNPATNQNFFIGADESATTPLNPGYSASNFDGFIWTPLQNVFSGYRAMFIRAEGGTAVDCPWLSASPTSGSIAPGGSQQVSVDVNAAGLAAGSYDCALVVSSNDPNEPSVTVPVHLNVAADAVIWIPHDVLEPNLAEKAQQRGLSLQDVEEMSIKPASHLELQAALEANGKSVVVVSELTAEILSGAEYLFAVLGIFPNNHVVKTTDAEAGIIETFIVSGGKVYLEGGDVWYYDPQFLGGYNFGPTFGILSSHDGADDLKTIFGECAAADKDFTYSGQNNFIDRLEPTGSACAIHTNSTPAYDCGIANDPPSGYRTIGNAFEFGGLDDASLSGSTKQTLMAAYLDFFDNGVSIASATFDFPLQNGGWYLISLPVTPGNAALNNLFPDAIAAFSWDFTAQSYAPVAELAPTKAYWVAMPAATTVEVFGQPVASYSRTYTAAGWDMIGAVMNSANLQAEPASNVFAMFGYDAAAGNYVSTRNFEPKEGYWIAIMADANNPLHITVGPEDGSAFTAASSPEFAKNFGAMPPPPPPFTVAANGLTAIPKEYGLLQNYPNPFNPETAIEFHLPEAGEVSLKVYNLLGREVRALVSGEKPAGMHRIIWDGRNEIGQKVDSGVYLYRLQVNGFVQTKKVLLVK